MGATHSRSDLYAQSLPEEYFNLFTEETLGLYFAINDKPVYTRPPSTNKNSLSAPPAKPTQKCQKQNCDKNDNNDENNFPNDRFEDIDDDDGQNHM